MKTIDQIKLNIIIGLSLIIIPLLGIPNSFKTFIIVSLGVALVYFAIVIRHREKVKKIEKHTHHKSNVFEESKPIKTRRTSSKLKVFSEPNLQHQPETKFEIEDDVEIRAQQNYEESN